MADTDPYVALGIDVEAGPLATIDYSRIDTILQALCTYI